MTIVSDKEMALQVKNDTNELITCTDLENMGFEWQHAVFFVGHHIYACVISE